MGVYINMEMPCDENDSIHILRDGTVVVYRTGSIDFYKAISVPAHGRLIGVDALWAEINKICDRRDAGIISDLTCLQQLLSAVRHAPTIIPADPPVVFYPQVPGITPTVIAEEGE